MRVYSSPQITTIRLAFRIALSTFETCAVESLDSAKNEGDDGKGVDASKGRKVVIQGLKEECKRQPGQPKPLPRKGLGQNSERWRGRSYYYSLLSPIASLRDVVLADILPDD